jgi:hypothetical protein
MSLINSLHSFFLKLSRPATIAAISVITLLFLWLINFQGVPGIPPIASLLRIGLPDMMFAYSPSSIYEKLVRFGADGRSACRMFLERVDFLFPAVYGLFFVTLTTLGFSGLFGQPTSPPETQLASLAHHSLRLRGKPLLPRHPPKLSGGVAKLGKARQRMHPRQVDFRRSQYCIVACGNFAFADSQSSSSSFCLEAWTGFQFERTHRGASLHA